MRNCVLGHPMISGNLSTKGECLRCKSDRQSVRYHASLKRLPGWINWKSMIDRCSTRSHASYRNYGGAGITVCDRWKKSYEAFIEDVGPPPAPGRQWTLDRFPNKSGNYEPGNVRWATQTEQQRNKRDNHIIASRGVALCISEWAERIGIPAHRISQRLRAGWTVEDSLYKPLKKNKRRHCDDNGQVE